MDLKCIGGLANGQVVNVPSAELREHDEVRVPAKITFDLSTFEEDLVAFKENRPPESVLDPYHYYLIGCLSWIDARKVKRKLFYLYPSTWDKFEALAFIIGP